MCLAVPGKIIEISGDETQACGRIGLVDFNGSQVQVSLELVPEVKVGSWVLVHAGFALEVLDEQQARETWSWLQQAEVGQAPPDLLDERSAGQTSPTTERGEGHG